MHIVHLFPKFKHIDSQRFLFFRINFLIHFQSFIFGNPRNCLRRIFGIEHIRKILVASYTNNFELDIRIVLKSNCITFFDSFNIRISNPYFKGFNSIVDEVIIFPFDSPVIVFSHNINHPFIKYILKNCNIL